MPSLVVELNSRRRCLESESSSLPHRLQQAVRVGVGETEAQRRLDMLLGGVPRAEACERRARPVVCRSRAGSEAQSSEVIVAGVYPAPDRQKGTPAIAPRQGDVGFEAQRRPIGVERFLDAPQALEGDAKVRVRARVFGIQPHRL